MDKEVAINEKKPVNLKKCRFTGFLHFPKLELTE
jgi:hypothetical protein